MSLRDLFAIHLAATMIFASPVFADDDDDRAPAMQIILDKKTGKKISQDDDSGRKAPGSSVVVQDMGRSAEVSATITQDAVGPFYHADGSMSARLGLSQMKYLVVTTDSEGNKTFSHVSTDPSAVEHALSADSKAGAE